MLEVDLQEDYADQVVDAISGVETLRTYTLQTKARFKRPEVSCISRNKGPACMNQTFKRAISYQDKVMGEQKLEAAWP